MAIKQKPFMVFSGPIDADACSQFVEFLVTYRNTPVTIYLNTEGGETIQAREIMNVIEWHGDVCIVAYGECASAGTLILCASEQRYGTKDCEFLIHFGEQVADSQKRAKAQAKEFKWYKNIYYKNLTASKKAITQWVNSQRELTSKEALKWNLIKGILR